MRYELMVNGKKETSDDAEPDDLLVDFLHERGLVGTRMACGIGSCGSCKVAVQTDRGMIPVLACFARLKSVEGLEVTTVEGLARNGKLHPLQQRFLEQYAFQCGYSTPGMLMTGAILIDRLKRKGGIPRHLLDREIAAAMAGHVCRCTGYVRYYQAIRDVILRWPQYEGEDPLVHAPGVARPADAPVPAVWFRVKKRSRNDVKDKILEGRFEHPDARLTLFRPMAWDACQGEVKARVANLRTGEPARDLNVARFLFRGIKEIVFKVDEVRPLDPQVPGNALPPGLNLPLDVRGRLVVGSTSVPAEAEVTVIAGPSSTLSVQSRRPVRVALDRLGLPVAAFAAEFGLTFGAEVELGLDNVEVTYTTRAP